MGDDIENFWAHADTFRQLRIHYMLEEHFSLIRGNGPCFRRWTKVAGLVVAAALAAVFAGIRQRHAP